MASRIVEKGVVVTISAGNSGETGPFFGSSGSSGEHVLAVASMEPNKQAAEPLKIKTTSPDGTSNTTTIAYMTLKYFITSPVLPIKAIKFNNSLPGEYHCDPLPEDTPDLSGYAILVPMAMADGCEDGIYVDYLLERGARNIIVYDTVWNDLYAPFFWVWGTNWGMITVVSLPDIYYEYRRLSSNLFYLGCRPLHRGRSGCWL